MIRIAKRESWRTFCTDIKDPNKDSRLRKIMAKGASVRTFTLVTKLEKSGDTIIGYADDIVILVQGKFSNTLSELLSQATRIVKTWIVENGAWSKSN